jgi:hypothetical protein
MNKILQLVTLAIVAAAGGHMLAATQAPQKPPAPSAEQQRLGYFVGNWTSEGEVKASPFGPAGKITGTDTCEWFSGRYAVICRSDGRNPLGPSKSVGIMGYSADAKAYTYYGVDNTPMAMASVAKGTRQGDTWTFLDEGTMGGQPYKVRITMKELSPTKYTFGMEMQGADGKWAPMMQATATKK